MNSKFYIGIEAFFESLRVLKKHSNIRSLALIPTFMSVLLLTTGLVGGVLYLNEILSWIMQKNVSDYSFAIKTLVYLGGFLILALAFYILVMILVSILSIPICVMIAQKTLQLKGWQAQEKNFGKNILSSVRMFKASIQKFFVFLFVASIVFMISVVPLIAPLSIFLSFLLISFDAMDYSLELEDFSFGKRIDFFAKNWQAMSGLSFCLMVLAIIPIIHILFLPIAVVSASLLYKRLS